MKSFEMLEGGILTLKGIDLFILPYYKSDITETDPNIRTLKGKLENDVKATLMAPHTTGEIIKIPYTVKSDVWLIYLSESVSPFALRSVLTSIFQNLESSSYKSIAIGQLAFIEYKLEDEEKWKRTQSSAMEEFAKNHPDRTLKLVVPSDDYRPSSGRHQGDEIIPKDGEAPEDIPEESSHHTISLNRKMITSYRDYFAQYIEARGLQFDLIATYADPSKTIESVADLQEELRLYELRDKKENFSKWAHGAKDKRTGVKYYPVPSKQKLKLIIFLLDMNYDEAIACLNFFGYGLARFDREDNAFAYMIRDSEHWPKPIDVARADATLRKRFGSSAAIIIKQGKKER